MNINWFRDEDNLVYINAEKDLHRLEVQLRLPGLEEAATMRHANPTPERLTRRGERGTTARLFIPDLLFGKHIEMGENIFLYRGDMLECYVIYWIHA